MLGGDGVTVTGNGSPQAGYTVSFTGNDPEACEAVTECVADHLGRGLVYNTATKQIQARLSSQDDNAISFGTDGGLYSNGSAAPGGSCAVTVDGLPDLFVGGEGGGAGLLLPWNSQAALNYAVGHQVPLIVTSPLQASMDGVACVPQYAPNSISTTRHNAFSNLDLSLADAHMWTSFTSYAGNPDVAERANSAARPKTGGGWYGFLAPVEQNITLAQWLHQLDGKAVAMLNTVFAGVTTRDITAVVEAVVQACAQDWTIIAVSDPANVPIVTDAGIQACIMMWPADYAAMPHTPEEITASGAKWVFMPSMTPDATITTYITAGLKVIAGVMTRHATRDRMFSLGVKGVTSNDPVYTRGPGASDYRQWGDRFAQKTRQLGMLTHLNDSTGGSLATNGTTSTTELGWFLNAGFGDAATRPTILLGWMCPLRDPTDYVLHWEARFDTIATTSTEKMGVLFSSLTDENTIAIDTTANHGNRPFKRDLYRAFMRSSGELAIAMWKNGAYTVLATTPTPAATAKAWNQFTLTVTDTKITFVRTVGATKYTVTTTDSTFRGEYVFLEKEELDDPFIGAWRQIVVDYPKIPRGATA